MSSFRIKYFKVMISSGFLLLTASCNNQHSLCHSNWKITGFYTPLANDFPSKLNRKIVVKDFKSFKFNHQFLKAVKMEGWGKTRFGWYLGFYSNQWHRSHFPLNAMGQELRIGAIAVDKNVIEYNTSVQIKAIQHYLGVSAFRAVDVGSAIKYKHIDIYTGEGLQARNLSYKVTGTHVVCF